MVAWPEGVVQGQDGKSRCGWGTTTADYEAYHDTEWGRPVHGDIALFERLTLEAFQSGLSWLTILRKRANFRSAFEGFDPDLIAAYGDRDTKRLLADTGIVRNKAKIAATITNARALCELRAAHGDGALDRLWWSFERPAVARRTALAEIPAHTADSKALARQLKSLGFGFVGPTTAYAAMQATGVVDDHLVACWRAGSGQNLGRQAGRG